MDDDVIPVADPVIGDQERALVAEALDAGWISPKGDFVDQFEREFAEYVGVDHAISTTTGTAALHLALVAAGVGPDDQVVVPDLTWIACANVVRYVGAQPVFADVDPETLTLDPGSVEAALTDRTAAVLPVHLFGHPCDMAAVEKIAAERDLFVLEDAAEAHGATARGESVGAIGDAGCFSFYANKLLTTGQGGMVTTDDDDLAERIRLYRRDGMDPQRKYYHPAVGYNYRLTNVQAAIGVGQLRRLDDVIEQKRQIAAAYGERLSSLPVDVPASRPWAEPVHWMTPVRFESAAARDRVVAALERESVETRPLFVPLHRQPPYRDAPRDATTAANDWYERGAVLPSGPDLEEDAVDRVCRTIAAALR